MKGKVVVVPVLGLLLVAVIIDRTPRPASGPAVASGVSPATVADRGGTKENAIDSSQSCSAPAMWLPHRISVQKDGQEFFINVIFA
ncbi:MAG TPA: hypothetical protein VF860_15320 [Candidatus Acidoferrales bacterium]